jgi:hypothetical protein
VVAGHRINVWPFAGRVVTKGGRVRCHEAALILLAAWTWIDLIAAEHEHVGPRQFNGSGVAADAE